MLTVSELAQSQFFHCYNILLLLFKVSKASHEETLKGIENAIEALEHKGLQTDPRYHQLVALRNFHLSVCPPSTASPICDSTVTQVSL